MRRYKILISCYACSPYKGSEPGMGWKFVKGISQHHEVHVITEKEKWESDIKTYLEENKKLKENLHFNFIHKKRNRKLRKFWPPSYYWYYKQWQKKAYSLALNLNEREDFDLVHQLNMVGFREPGYLWKMDIPFVWGPIGGMENTNYKLLLNLPFKELVFYGLRNIINSYQKRFLQRPRKAAKHPNSILISATKKNQLDIKKYWQTDSIIMPEVGQELFQKITINKRGKDEALKLVWIGQHTGGKALNILLKSLKLLNENIIWELNVLGDGTMTNRWKRLATKLGVNARCKWHGWVDKKMALELLRNSHLLCITSIKDLTSTVTLEGLSFGLPIVTLDHCGFSNVIDENCGIKMPIAYPKQLQLSYKMAIENLYNDESLRYDLAVGALERSKMYSWENKIGEVNSIYNSLLKN